MLGRSERARAANGGGGVVARHGDRVQGTEMAARSSREELKRITAAAAMTSQPMAYSGSGASAAPAVGSINAVVAAESTPRGKRMGGDGGLVGYA